MSELANSGNLRNPNSLTVSVSPHLKDKATTSGIMLEVIIALVPAFIASIIIFGARAALVVFACVASAVGSEWIFTRLMRKPDTILDFSAAITGILLAYNLPVGIPIWQAVFGSAVAIILVKQLFGGLGKNFANPAITARIIMFLAFSVTMTSWPMPGMAPDAISSATPLFVLSEGTIGALPSLWYMFLGIHGGCLGETSALALLLGGTYLLVRRVITWHIPVAFIATVFIFCAALGQQPVYQILSGGLLIGAIFMATDYVTSPSTAWGKIIFGIGSGFITVVIRIYGSSPEGVSFSILLMNNLTPFINSLSIKKAFGRAG
jgi:electron transport complex protein RnfD